MPVMHIGSLFTMTQTPEEERSVFRPNFRGFNLLWQGSFLGGVVYQERHSREDVAGKMWHGRRGRANLCGYWPGSRGSYSSFSLSSPLPIVFNLGFPPRMSTFRVGLPLQTNEFSLDSLYRCTQRSVSISLVRTQSSYLPEFCLSDRALTGTLLSHQPPGDLPHPSPCLSQSCLHSLYHIL